MKGTLTVIGVDGGVTTTPLTGAPPLEALQKAVGGYIEPVPFFARYKGEPCVALCNEEGKNNDLPRNDTATALWEDAVESVLPDYLVGPVVIITGDNELLESL